MAAANGRLRAAAGTGVPWATRKRKLPEKQPGIKEELDKPLTSKEVEAMDKSWYKRRGYHADLRWSPAPQVVARLDGVAVATAVGGHIG